MTPRRPGILSVIGNTPMVEIQHLCPNRRVRLLAKLEGNNPGGSVKDRIAYYMVEKAEEAGQLTREKVLLEPTSGNTGIGVAMVGAAKGYRVKLTMPACVSVERRNVLMVLGAELELTASEEGTDGAIRRAHEILAREPGKYFMLNQFENENNALAHYETTGPEVLAQSNGEVDVFVAGMGTTGTLMGVSRFMKERHPQTKIIGVEPVPGHKIQGLKNMQEAIVPKIFRPALLDGKVTVEDDAAYETARKLATREGVFVGMSSGAAMWAALELAQDMRHGTVVALLPDRGDRYLSTELFRSICAKCPP
ncbi:MAG: PLP-dependent cysteine synthase family protein [Planctomycetes bacterium]|nr:PLP-dependent cysteine synthase family protein [Planctomycetota bacterium]MBM4079301.1 PLP-dependent cysteine synthase family protein [Planctomycetota bacterium]